MKPSLRRGLGAVFSGLLFGLGLTIGGMTQPSKVLGFLDVAGAWDPSLLCMMAGAVAVHALGYRWVTRRATPLAAPRFSILYSGAVDARLLSGAGLFGVGWGLSGYCPGPAVVSLASGSFGVLCFSFFAILGIWLVNAIEARSGNAPEPAALAER